MRRALANTVLVALLIAGFNCVGARSAGADMPSTAGKVPAPLPPPLVDEPAPSSDHSQRLVLAGGCFWGIQGVFAHVRGVREATSGYSGGSASTAFYPMVSSGLTGHAESVAITYNPRQISLGQLLQIFFSVALDPTEVDRQGPDHGTQYRSAIFSSDPVQQKVAAQYIAQLDASQVFAAPIATRIEPLRAFYPAESYHQNFLTLHPTHGYIVAFDLPKVALLQQQFPQRYRADAVLSPTNR